MDWISVDDRLPEKADIYLCALNSGGVWFGMYRPSRYAKRPGSWALEDCEGLSVTHWTPLPPHPTTPE